MSSLFFEWDPLKNNRNIDKHGISFEDATLIFNHFIVQFPDNRNDYGEERIVVLGKHEKMVVYLVYTPRENNKRLISVRIANAKERMVYNETLQNRLGSLKSTYRRRDQ